MNQLNFAFSNQLDAEFLNSLYEDDLEYAGEIFKQYVQQSTVISTTLQSLYDAGHIENFRREIHKLKPVFSYVGLSVVSRKATIIEDECRTVSNINYLEVSFKNLMQTIDETNGIVKNELERIKECIAV